MQLWPNPKSHIELKNNDHSLKIGRLMCGFVIADGRE